MREDRNFKASNVSGPSIWIFILCLGPRKDAHNREVLGTRMVSDRNRTCGPAILVQRSKQAAQAIKLSSSINCKLRSFRSNCSRNENVLKLPRRGVYDIFKVKSHKKVGVTELVKKI